MNEQINLDDLAYRCSDQGELTTKVEAAIHAGDKVNFLGFYDGCKEQVSINSAFDLVGEENALKYLANIKRDVYPVDFSDALDEQIFKLAVAAARSYKGKYDE